MIDLFLIIFRNKVLRQQIFKEIKSLNKRLRFVRYNYYETNLEFIIKTKNQSLLKEKIKDYYFYNSEIIKTNQDNHRLNLNQESPIDISTFHKFLEWKEIELETFKEIFKILIDNNSIETQSTKPLKLDNYGENLNFEILEHLNQSPYAYIYSLSKRGLFQSISGVINSMPIFNYLFCGENLKDLGVKFKLELPEINDLLVANVKSGSNNSNEVNKEIFKLFEPESAFDLFKNQNLIGLIYTLIEYSNLEMLKLILERLEDTNYNTGTKHIEYVNLYGYNISLQLIKELKLKIYHFDNSDKSMLPLFKIMVEKVWGESIKVYNLSSFSHGTIYSNGDGVNISISGCPDYSDYFIDFLIKNNIKICAELMRVINFSYKCIRKDNNEVGETGVNNNELLWKYMKIDYYKSRMMNDDLKLFKAYILKFGFCLPYFKEIIGLGYENMVKEILKDQQLLDRIQGLRKDMLYIELLQLSVNKQYQNIFDFIQPRYNQSYAEILVSPSINSMLNLFTYLNNCKLPLDLEKRMVYINNISKIKNFQHDKSLSLNLSLLYNILLDNKYLEYVDTNPKLITNPTSKLRLFIDCIRLGNFKLLKRFSGYYKSNDFKTFKEIRALSNFRSLFYLISKLGYFQLYWPPNEGSKNLIMELINTILSSKKEKVQNGESLFKFIFSFNNFFNLFNYKTEESLNYNCNELLSKELIADYYLYLFQLKLIDKTNNQKRKLLKFDTKFKTKLHPNNNLIQQILKNDLNNNNNNNFQSIISIFDIGLSKPLLKFCFKLLSLNQTNNNNNGNDNYVI